MSCVLVVVVVIARDYLYLFVSLSLPNFILGFGLDLLFGGIMVSRE